MRARFTAAFLLLGACSGDTSIAEISPDPTSTGTPTSSGPSVTPPPAPGVRDAGADRVQPLPGKQGTFNFLTYNVAGLPKAISSRHPEVDVKKMSAKLNAYDIVAVQEDFAYHDDLIAQLTLPNRTKPKGSGSIIDMGDGLNAFSKFALTGADRDKWKDCNGLLSEKSDCFAPKGLLKFTIELAPGVEVDVYNIHTDAGRTAKDAEARDNQVAQLNAKIEATSKGKAILVVGDTNMNQSDEATLQALLVGAKLTDACRKLSCPEPARYDRVMYRDGAMLKFTLKDWHIETTFRDSAGNELSDHEPVKVVFDWTAQ
jgi:endonuclease/exonuclease/phosphatase family metal-dependent hydrolase